MELVSALKEGASSSSLAAPMMKTKQAEGVFVVDVEGVFPSEQKKNNLTPTFASTSSPIFPFSRYAKAIHEVLIYLGAPPYLICCPKSNFI